MFKELLEHRVGKFHLTKEFIEDNPFDAMNIFSKCLIVRAESIFYSNSVEYIAYSQEFKPCAEGSYAPEYTWIFDKEWKANVTNS